MASKTIKKILIIKPSALGDIAHALAALASVRKSFPDAHITWLVRKEFAPLLEMADALDDMIIFDRKLLGKWYRSPRVFAELMRFFKSLRKPHFDMVIDLQGLFRTALFSWITGSKKRFGIKGARECAGIFYSDSTVRDDGDLHIVDLNNKIVAAAGATETVVDSGLTIDPQTQSAVEQLLAENDCEDKKYAILVTGAAHARKLWPAEKFAEISDLLHSQFGLSVITIGTEIDKPHVERLKAIAKKPVIDLTGKTNIKVMTALMSKAAIVVSNDTGPGHVAEATGAPVVMIFGPTNPARLYPYSRPESFVAIDSFTRGLEVTSSDPKYAIDNITVDAVSQKVSGLLNSLRQ